MQFTKRVRDTMIIVQFVHWSHMLYPTHSYIKIKQNKLFQFKLTSESEVDLFIIL